MPLDIDENKLNDTTYIYFVNYYGLFKDNIQKIIDKYKYVIVDNTHLHNTINTILNLICQ